jgi:hypothetical protein
MLVALALLEVRCRKLEMQGLVGNHAPANTNKLIMTRAAIINSLPMRTV